MSKHELIFPVNLDTKYESNLFLRAVWARFRTEFGKCAWAFMPINDRVAKLTSLGRIDLGTDNTIEVSIRYKKRGTVQMIEFEDTKGGALPEKMHDILKDILSTYKVSRQRYVMKIVMNFQYPMVHYELPHIAIVPTENGSNVIKMAIMGYDERDARFVFKKKLNNIVDSLAAFLWTDVKYGKNDTSKELKTEGNVFIDDVELNLDDEFGVYKENYYLTERALSFMDRVVKEDSLSKAMSRFLSAARLYKNGIKLEDISRQAVGQGIDYTEMVMVAYMSSLEVLAADEEIKAETCSVCGQQKYSIAKRVRDLADKASNGNEYFIKGIKDFYNNRSKFLHEGSFGSADSFIDGVLPQVNESEDGVEHQVYYLNTLRFQVGKIFQWVLKNSPSL